MVFSNQRTINDISVTTTYTIEHDFSSSVSVYCYLNHVIKIIAMLRHDSTEVVFEMIAYIDCNGQPTLSNKLMRLNKQWFSNTMRKYATDYFCDIVHKDYDMILMKEKLLSMVGI